MSKKRLSLKQLDRIKKLYHMDCPIVGAYRSNGNSIVCRNLYVEELVNEIEACWEEKEKI